LLLAAAAADRNNIAYTKSASGLEYYDYSRPSSTSTTASSQEVKKGDRVVLNVKGYLAGRQGWLFLDTFNSKQGEAVRITIGETPCIKGLEQGLLGDGTKEGMPPMTKGGKRRLVVPSRLGYTSRGLQPEPQDEGARRRLYSTVLNEVRGERERQALGGDSVVGKIILDVEVVAIKGKREK